MLGKSFKLRKRLQAIGRRIREIRMIAKGVASTSHPILAHIIPIRRCNLACGYCNEYDSYSKPVPTEIMLDRVDHLGRLGTSIMTISGGEPLLHPDLDEIIRRIRKNRALAGMITNGYLLTAERIHRLNEGARQETATTFGARAVSRQH
jgi:MoaA/NifB/PqqE/SkfB family radical SAM enzyme